VALIRFFLAPILLYKRRMIYVAILVVAGLWLIPRLPFPKPASVEQTAVTEAARESSGRPAAEPAGPPPATGGVGQELVSGGLLMEVQEVRRDASAAGARQAGPGRVFVITRLRVQGTTGVRVVFKTEFLRLRDEQGRVYPTEPTIKAPLAGWLAEVSDDLRLGHANFGLVHFEVPQDATGLVLHYDQRDIRWEFIRFRILLDG